VTRRLWRVAVNSQVEDLPLLLKQACHSASDETEAADRLVAWSSTMWFN
jgi:hypothetical protein